MIQGVIDKDTIYLGKSNYQENIIGGKGVVIKPLTGVNCIVTSLDSSKPVFTLIGNGTTIYGLNITGSTSNAGVYIINGSKNQIYLNTIKDNRFGILISNSTENEVVGNEIINNSVRGIGILNNASNNTVSDNRIKFNTFEGVCIENSNDNKIMANIIPNNKDSINLSNASTKINYNIIRDNSRYGLYNSGNGTANATNNWWGTNTPQASSDPAVTRCDVFVAGGTVLYDPYLVLNLTISTDRSDRNGTYYNYEVTADLTRNNKGEDTSSTGNVPDDIPVNFLATLGAITGSATTRKGKATVRLNGTSAGLGIVNATLDNQTVSMPINVTSIDNLGVYNARNGKYYKSIQEAANDPSTVNGDIITVKEGIYTENVRIDKRLTLKPDVGAVVTVRAKDSDKSVFVVGHDGSGTTIQGFNIIGSTSSYGISLSHAYNCQINNNTITNSSYGVYLYLSGNNSVMGNDVSGGSVGILLYGSAGNQISDNCVYQVENGIRFVTSNYNTVSSNRLLSDYFGVFIFNSNNNKIMNIVCG